MPTPPTSAQHEDELLAPGVAFPLVRKLLALNESAPADAPRVEVILLSRNSSDTGLRIFNSIEHHGLAIARAAFSNGAPPYPYIRPFGADLFLSTHGDDVRSALAAGVAAATILPAAQRASTTHRSDQLRIAFDGDAVIFGDESERVSREGGLAAFAENERVARRGAVVRRALPRLPRRVAAPAEGLPAQARRRRFARRWSPRDRRRRTSA